MARAVALGGTYNTGQDCTAATRVYVAAGSTRGCRRRAPGVDGRHPVRRPPGSDTTDIGPLISTAHRDAGCTDSSAARVAAGAEAADRRLGAGRRRRLLPADARGRRRPVERDRPGRGLRPGARGRAVRRARTRRSGWPTTALRPGVIGLDARRRTRPAGQPPRSTSVSPGSTTTCRSRRRRRTAGSRAAASART